MSACIGFGVGVTHVVFVLGYWPVMCCGRVVVCGGSPRGGKVVSWVCPPALIVPAMPAAMGPWVAYGAGGRLVVG